MKHNLGKIVLFTLSCFILQAEDFVYKLKVDNNHPFVKEAVLLTFDVNQTNHDIVLLFDFNLVKSSDYIYKRIDMEELDTNHAIKLRYTYLIYPLKDKDTAIHFKLTKKVTTDDSIAYSFSGDRDNVKGLVTKDYTIDLPPLTLHCKALPKKTQLVGDFTLTYKFKKHQAKAYEPLPFQITLKGVGYPPILDTSLLKGNNFTLFTEKPIVHSTFTKQDTKSTVIYPMALSHDTNFTLPSITVNAFNPKLQKSYLLTVPMQNFHITKVNSQNLVDTLDSPPPLAVDWEWLKQILGYFIIFITGFLTAMALKWQKKAKPKTSNPLQEKIQNAKDEKSLLQILMSHNSHHFKTLINQLENSLYGNGKINLAKLKQEAMEKIK